MKKVLAFVLVLALATGCCLGAMAATTYSSMLLVLFDDNSATTMLSSPDLAIACLVIEQGVHDSSTWMNSVAYSGYSYIADYGGCIDAYILMSDGRYYNLYFNPDTGMITDYGYQTSKPSSTKYTYVSTSNTSIISRVSYLIQMLTD